MMFDCPYCNKPAAPIEAAEYSPGRWLATLECHACGVVIAQASGYPSAEAAKTAVIEAFGGVDPRDFRDEGPDDTWLDLPVAEGF